MLGSAFVFFMKKDIPDRLQKTLLGFASGVMVAASVWSLLIPSIEMARESVVPAAVGFLAGIVFLLLIDELTPHLHVGAQKAEGPHSRLSRTMMLALAVTIHNLPEGMAVGGHHLDADARRGQLAREVVPHRHPERRGGARRLGGNTAPGGSARRSPTLPACVCRRCHDVCRGGRAHPGDRPGQTYQSLHHRFRRGIRADDGDGRAAGVESDYSIASISFSKSLGSVVGA